MPISLMKTESLDFERDDLTSAGRFDSQGKYVPAGTVSLNYVEGNLQPFRTGNNILKNGDYRRMTEAGYSAEDAKIFYTPTKLYSDNQFTKRKADRTTIDGFPYKVFSVKDWKRYGLGADHYEVILVRSDQPAVTASV